MSDDRRSPRDEQERDAQDAYDAEIAELLREQEVEGHFGVMLDALVENGPYAVDRYAIEQIDAIYAETHPEGRTDAVSIILEAYAMAAQRMVAIPHLGHAEA